MDSAIPILAISWAGAAIILGIWAFIYHPRYRGYAGAIVAVAIGWIIAAMILYWAFVLPMPTAALFALPIAVWLALPGWMIGSRSQSGITMMRAMAIALAILTLAVMGGVAYQWSREYNFGGADNVSEASATPLPTLTASERERLMQALEDAAKKSGGDNGKNGRD